MRSVGRSEKPRGQVLYCESKTTGSGLEQNHGVRSCKTTENHGVRSCGKPRGQKPRGQVLYCAFYFLELKPRGQVLYCAFYFLELENQGVKNQGVTKTRGSGIVLCENHGVLRKPRENHGVKPRGHKPRKPRANHGFTQTTGSGLVLCILFS